MRKIRAKKSLGQHFLRSQAALRAITDAAKIKEGENILEIGPGEGALTQHLLDAGARVIAVETDTRCVSLLKETFATQISQGKLSIIEGDVLSKETQQVIFDHEYIGKAPYKIVANIPYYITGALFRLFLETLRQPQAIVFLVQKEVAEQIVARDKKEGILSLSVKIYGDPRYVAKIKKDAFSPPPKVDSAVIAIENISRERLGTLSDKKYFAVIKAGLKARRKMLLGNLAHELHIPRKDMENIFHTLGIESNIRGEDLPLSQWIALVRAIITRQG